MSFEERTIDGTLKQKITLNRQAETMKFFNKKLYTYLNKKLISKSNYFSYSDIFIDKKLLEESFKQDLIKSKSKLRMDYFYNENVKNYNTQKDTDIQNLKNDQEFYNDYDEYYYDQNIYENDYLDGGNEFFKIDSQNSINPQILRYKSQVLNVFNDSNLIDNLILRFILFFHLVNFFLILTI